MILYSIIEVKDGKIFTTNVLLQNAQQCFDLKLSKILQQGRKFVTFGQCPCGLEPGVIFKVIKDQLCGQTQRSVVGTSRPVVMTPRSVVGTSRPVVMTPRSVVGTSRPVVMTPRSVVGTSRPVVMTPRSVVGPSRPPFQKSTFGTKATWWPWTIYGMTIWTTLWMFYKLMQIFTGSVFLSYSTFTSLQSCHT